MLITLAQLRAIAPRAPGTDLDQLNAALPEADISTPMRAACFLGHLAEETIQFTHFTEVWGPTAAQTRYERPLGAELVVPGPGVHLPLWQRLGNVNAGDGKFFSGRGGIQLTGRANFTACGNDLDVDLVSQPQLAATPELRYRVSAWYWRIHNLNVMADAGDVVGLTRAINGPGMNGLRDRQAFTDTAIAALGALPVCQ